MFGIYLAAGFALHKNYHIVYQDMNGLRDISGDMLNCDLSGYDFIIATPPCNFWSRCNYRRYKSKYALDTFHLLPEIIKKLCKQDKPFIVENVRNYKLFDEFHLFDFPCFVYIIGRHTYWSNILFSCDIDQRQDFLNGGYVIKYDDMKNKYHQGGYNVHQVIERFLSTIHHEKSA